MVPNHAEVQELQSAGDFQYQHPPISNWKSNISVLIPNRLYLGNITAGRSSRSLTEHRITHILSVCADDIPAQGPNSGIHHMRIDVPDFDYADLLIHLPSAVRFIDQALKNGGVVLVHCVQGTSRSAAVVAAYVMWSRRMNATQALDFVRSVRDTIWPNPGFQEQLVLYELCQYQPSPRNGIYATWRTLLDRRLAAAIQY
ncbi:protein-tyrosine phosphatase-like protein [Mycena floridula]|nr:protein-tyrosine phosphatase-like protein [Mycena floridula]